MRTRRKQLRFPLPQLITIVVLLTLALTNIQAQTDATTASLSGTVRDPQGALVTNATVTVNNAATNLSRSAQTNSNGNYQIVQIPPGQYRVTAEAPNFKRAQVPAITLTVGQNATLDIPLEVGPIGES